MTAVRVVSTFELWVWRGVLVALGSACAHVAIDVFMGQEPGTTAAVAVRVLSPF